MDKAVFEPAKLSQAQIHSKNLGNTEDFSQESHKM